MEGGLVLRGTLIAESLRNGIVLEGLNLRVTRVVRGDFGDEAKHQPRTWTLCRMSDLASGRVPTLAWPSPT